MGGNDGAQRTRGMVRVLAANTVVRKIVLFVANKPTKKIKADAVHFSNVCQKINRDAMRVSGRETETSRLPHHHPGRVE